MERIRGQGHTWVEKRNLIATGDKNPLLREVRQLVNDEVWERINKALKGNSSLNSSGYVYTKFALIARRNYIIQDKGTQFQKR